MSNQNTLSNTTYDILKAMGRDAEFLYALYQLYPETEIKDSEETVQNPFENEPMFVGGQSRKEQWRKIHCSQQQFFRQILKFKWRYSKNEGQKLHPVLLTH